MKKVIPLYFLLGIVLTIGILHFIGIYFYLYWRVPSFDRVVHLLGGFFVAYMSLSVVYSQRFLSAQKSHIIMLGIFAALVIGFMWEVFELQNGITSTSDRGYWLDALSDIVSDMLGGVAAVAYFISMYNTKNNER